MGLGGGHEVPFPAKELLAINSLWERNSQFSRSVLPWKVNHAPVDGPTPKNICAAQNEHSRLWFWFWFGFFPPAPRQSFSV